MGGGEGGLPHKIPDWRTYKAEGIPELDRLQKRLGAHGLRDPWIRNEAWKFTKENGGNVRWYQAAMKNMFRGFIPATIAVVITVAVDKAFFNKGDDGHGHH